MSDELDLSEERMEFDRDISIKNIQEKARNFEQGAPGECDLCGETFVRLVPRIHLQKDVKVCGRCRDKHGLK